MTAPATGSANPRRAALAALVGTSIEWYDFYAFATAAAIVFNDVFFPADMPPLLRTLSSFGTFAVGFLLRPLGGIVFGHIGDRIGRKKTLVTTLLMMGIASFCIGLLPTYAQIGAAAPALLIVLRLVQGIAIGGEWGGAVLVAVESAPKGKATFFGSFAQLGSSVGALLSTGAFSLMNLFGSSAFHSWGWRVPFLLSAVLVGVGLVVRLRLEESPAMAGIEKQRQPEDKLPIVEVLQKDWRTVLFGVLGLATATGGYYLVTSYLLAYADDHAHVSQSMLLNGLTLAAFLELVVTPWLSLLGDRIGAHTVVIAGLAGVVVLAVPQFLVVHTGSTLLIWGAMLAMRFVMSALYGPMAAILAEGFDARVRYTGISLSYQLCNLVFGGFSPIIAASLSAAAGGSYWPVAALLMVVSLIGIVSISRLRARRSALLTAGTDHGLTGRVTTTV
ncbi:MFS transporter [Streptomyces nodosus]|uniref:Putative proline/betaine transporter n=1 Tax=Streptomyces nodosus TaxID=40318 RepID=A0A5P2WD78_9ACTN|nr:MFS transporter [Streptomyces nodosus]MBB4795831.1 metabolite-proton symporter [Streptomyces nodosus]QEV42712.1 MFS transporter [Streptomyces nodosus]